MKYPYLCKNILGFLRTKLRFSRSVSLIYIFSKSLWENSSVSILALVNSNSLKLKSFTRYPFSRHSSINFVPGKGVKIERVMLSIFISLTKRNVFLISSSVSPGNPIAKKPLVIIPNFLVIATIFFTCSRLTGFLITYLIFPDCRFQSVILFRSNRSLSSISIIFRPKCRH